MQPYAQYLASLDEILGNSGWGLNAIPVETLHAHLNGGAAKNLLNLVDRKKIRESGAFFTGETLGRRLVDSIAWKSTGSLSAWDPTCGAGDLLLRWSEKLPVFPNLCETLKYWGRFLHGQDIHAEFIAVAKRRLILAAIGRGSLRRKGSIKNADRLFPNLRQLDFLSEDTMPPSTSVILMNPPFTVIETPPDCKDWSSGLVSFAAVALYRCLKEALPGQQVSAILPDVLRSGSRYAKWRNRIGRLMSEGSAEVIGRFNDSTDVDVFILNAVAGADRNESIQWMIEPESQYSRSLNSICNIRVGTVVPHRLKPSKKEVAYLATSNSPAWSEIDTVTRRIFFEGASVKGPFIAVRRTSSPSDKSRAIATVVTSRQEVVLENHLFSILPRDKKLLTCRSVAKYLKSEYVKKWLNQKIRCRHLTVSALKQLPIPDDL
ncbi:MAG: SAM-dependent DNA methyltransferase [Proteobacteria bacterium]|nr:MAG: SAM-dependent DNA methyltransferase [Pseudomonadota bacterium]